VIRITDALGSLGRGVISRQGTWGKTGVIVAAVVTAEFLNLDATRLQQEVLRLRRCIQKLTALLRILLVVFRISGYSLNQARLPDGHDKRLLLRAIEQSRSTLPLRALLRVLRLSPSRFYHWKRDQHCALDDRPSCPRLSPQQLTAALAHSQPAPEKGTLVALL